MENAGRSLRRANTLSCLRSLTTYRPPLLGYNVFVSEDPSNSAKYKKAASKTLKLESQRRIARERYDDALREVIQLEVEFGIAPRWTPLDSNYNEALKFLAERKYRRALEHLQQLVVQRLFELHKMNLSGTGEFYHR